MANISIFGSGAMGTAVATILANNGHNITIYGIDDSELNDLKNGRNTKYFEDVNLPKFKVTKDKKQAVEDCNYIVFAIPTKALPETYKEVIKLIKKQVIIINVSKGFWKDSNKSCHEIMTQEAQDNSLISGVVSLIGPSFAIDIINKNITAVDAVSNNDKLNKKVQKLFSNDYFRVYTQKDVAGAESGSIFKNILAIASGMVAGLGYSTNSQIALITRGFNELKKFVLARGGKLKTIFGLSCLGDLMLTALSDKSRNYTFGKNFYNKNFDSSKLTVEGLRSIEIVYDEYIKTKLLDLPIVNSLYQIIYKNANPNEIIINLMKRKLKSE
ncbi:NAD(P)H-dependent glycerol-3-phosphate dehydrogenase [Metamycoplasma hominis]|uniref:Glycerol-3-phosphate dehydrogenase n=1 Tax=Metamycoplasma hominis TaxID=2098 RepID=A0A6A8Q107_METHO|nr:NAD(P)H-dependent glycerol-3-phosphate dehydrogenase [Metamycoplasma hominis]MTH75585.1 NAD(P)H-dependent glycerol-3-phosphate dehydrogenase [Metamycoplasma hominis]